MMSTASDQFTETLQNIPAACQQEVRAVLDEIAPHLPETGIGKGLPHDWRGALPMVLCCSRFIAGLLRRDASYLTELIENGSLFSALDISRLSTLVSSALAETSDEQEIMHILRRARNQAMLQIAFRDLAGWAPLDEVMNRVSQLAELLLSVTMDKTHELLVARHGSPLGSESGEPQRLIGLGMGKLGGGELNFSSDVDLIFTFPENGETGGQRPLSNSEFFTSQARLIIKLMTTLTADGFVYRVDTRLRPNGDSGPLTLSFSAMDNYYQLHGRDWERYAFIKAKVVAGDRTNGQYLLDSLRPFVYRKYLDYAAVESIRNMKGMIERELTRKKEMQRNIKLGAGGIREVEFIAQAHQLIRGGRQRDLQHSSLLTVLERLKSFELIDDSEYGVLTRGYEFLRRCENRIQMYADQQTHNLPDSDTRQTILARSMGFPDWTTFHDTLQGHMQAIHAIFDELFMTTAKPDDDAESLRLSDLWQNLLDEQAALELLNQHNYQQSGDLYRRLMTIRGSSMYRNLSVSAKERMDRLLPVLLLEVGHADDPDQTMLRCLELLASIARRSVYMSLLLDNDAVRTSLIRLTSASPYVSTLLNRYPILLDDLLTGYTLDDFADQKLAQEMEKLLSSYDMDDLEQLMNLLREFRHSKYLGVAALAINHNVTAMQTGRAITAIADACIRKSMDLSIQEINAVHGVPAGYEQEPTPFCVIGYGKLGSRELGFGSDLDLVFISASLPDSVKTIGDRKVYAPQYFARVGQRLVHIMTTRTSAGRLYEVDMRLRPSGNSGPLVATITQMQKYQRKRAWTWEQQALVRARFIAGDAGLGSQFSRLRREILTRKRDDTELIRDVVEMREKIREAKNTSGKDEFDLKQGPGGIVDIEFMVQYKVLRWANEYSQLCDHTETLALLDLMHDLGLVEPGQHGVLHAAFACWLERSYQLKLNVREAIIPDSEDRELRDQVIDIWRSMFPRENLKS